MKGSRLVSNSIRVQLHFQRDDVWINVETFQSNGQFIRLQHNQCLILPPAPRFPARSCQRGVDQVLRQHHTLFTPAAQFNNKKYIGGINRVLQIHYVGTTIPLTKINSSVADTPCKSPAHTTSFQLPKPGTCAAHDATAANSTS